MAPPAGARRRLRAPPAAVAEEGTTVEALTLIEGWPVARAAAGVARASGEPATRGPAETAFDWASVTKLLTAYTALMVVDEGIAALDEPAGPESASLRHLLAHASGLPPDASAPIASAGSRRIYSNAGYEAVGRHLEARTGIGFAELVTENVLEPLGMAATTVTGSPAAGARGPLTDLLAFARELLAPTLVSRRLLDEATAVQFPGIGGVLPGFGRQEPNDWGLGFELRDGKDPHWTGSRNSPATFGHFGLSGSFLWVDPTAGLACGALADRDFGGWARRAWPELSDAVVSAVGG